MRTTTGFFHLIHFIKIYLHKSIATYITICYITLRNTMIYNKGKGDRKMSYKYYKSYVNETNRPEWLVYMDHLIDCGREYPCAYGSMPEFMCLSNAEHRRLTSLLFQDNTLADREEIMTSFNRDDIMTSFNRDELSYAIIGYIESDSLDAEKRIEKRIATIIASNILRSYEPVIVELFDDVRAIQTPPANAESKGELINE